jgi:hypothetical protein
LTLALLLGASSVPAGGSSSISSTLRLSAYVVPRVEAYVLTEGALRAPASAPGAPHEIPIAAVVSASDGSMGFAVAFNSENGGMLKTAGGTVRYSARLDGEELELSKSASIPLALSRDPATREHLVSIRLPSGAPERGHDTVTLSILAL